MNENFDTGDRKKYMGNLYQGEALIWCLLGKWGMNKGRNQSNLSFFFFFLELSIFLDGVIFYCGGK